MDHVDAIRKYVEALRAIPDLHVLIIEGPAGWGKTTTVDKALELAGVDGVHLGAYSTPLNLYNFLAENSDRLIVIDDCAGLFNDQSSMAILKASTWPSKANKRIVKWGSTSNKATTPEFEFHGQFVIVCNSFPSTPDGEAIRSRGYARRFDITLTEAKTLLHQAAKDRKWFPKTKIAESVSAFLIERLNENTLPKISYRTLKNGYRLAEYQPKSWEDLLAPMLPAESIDPEKLVRELSRQKLQVKEQARIFELKTGLKERSFYNYRRANKISRTSGPQVRK